MKILVINGPNLNLLGKRNQTHYGDLTLEKIEELVKKEFKNIEFNFFQSNLEGEIVEKIQSAGNGVDAIIINPGGYAHSSVAIRDALEIQKMPKIEVHLSHLVNRENFRQNLITASGCNGYISGFKENGYLSAVYLIKKILNHEDKKK
jgi:3-dehydroquinate dehydratase-2